MAPSGGFAPVGSSTGHRHVGAHVPSHAPGRRRLEQNRGLRLGRCIDLAKRGDVVQDPEPAAVGRHHQVVVLHDEVAHRRGRHVQPQRLPVRRRRRTTHRPPLGAGEQQALALRILAHGVHRLAGRNACHDLRPGLAAVVRAVDVRAHVVEAERVDRRVGGQRVEPSRVDDRHLRPWRRAPAA